MDNMQILVTGGKGFVGQKLIPSLSRTGHSVSSLDKSEGFDLTDKNMLNKIGNFDVLVHLAGLSFVPDSYNDPERYYRTNFLTTLNALELCRKYKAKMVFISSYVYGTPQYLPIDEKHPVSAFNPYAQAKIICEKLCEGYHRDFKLPLIILRPFNIFGNGQDVRFLIPTIMNKLVSGSSAVNLKDPNPKRDYVHINDVVRAIGSAVNSTNYFGVYNICSNSSYSVKEITEIIKRASHKQIEFHFDVSGERNSEVADTLGCYEKIHLELGWSPAVTFEEGIKQDLKELGM